MNELHTTINGTKEEGTFRDYREWRGDPPAKKTEYQWNGYPLPKGLRINVWFERQKSGPGSGDGTIL